MLLSDPEAEKFIHQQIDEYSLKHLYSADLKALLEQGAPKEALAALLLLNGEATFKTRDSRGFRNVNDNLRSGAEVILRASKQPTSTAMTLLELRRTDASYSLSDLQGMCEKIEP